LNRQWSGLSEDVLPDIQEALDNPFRWMLPKSMWKRRVEKKRRRLTGGEFEFLLLGGAERDRTVDLLNAIRGLVVDLNLRCAPAMEPGYDKIP